MLNYTFYFHWHIHNNTLETDDKLLYPYTDMKLQK